MKNICLTGYRISDLDSIEEEAKKLLENTIKARKKMFEASVLAFVTEPTKEVEALDKALHHKLDDVLLRIKNPKNEIILGSLYDLQQKFGDVNVAELLVSVGLFSKVHYYHNEYSPYEDHKFDSEEDYLNCLEVCEDTGETKYYDPIAGEQVTKEVFEENKYYTIRATPLYYKIYSELLEAYQNMKIY